MKTSLILAAAALAGLAAATDESKTQVDAKALAPILSHAWSEQACDGPDAYVYLHDWVVDTDGTPFERAGGGYTPLTELTFKDGMLTQTDEVGVAKTIAVFKLLSDGTLKPWSRSETGEEAGAGPQIYIKDGKYLIGDDGEPLKPAVDTVVMHSCPQRTAMFPAEASLALDGVWAEVKGGACGTDKNAMTIDLKRPVPAMIFGPTEALPSSSQYWVMAISQVEKAWDVTAGGSFDAFTYHLTPGADGTLTLSDDSPDPARIYKRCPK